MPSTTVTSTRPPAPRNLPAGVTSSRVWRDRPGGALDEHDFKQPVDEATMLPTGAYWRCPEPECETGEWVFPKDGEPGFPKAPFCTLHGKAVQADGAAKAAAEEAAQAWLRAKVSAAAADARQRVADAAAARLVAARTAARQEVARLGGEAREHLPSAGLSFGALVADYALLSKLEPLQNYAIGTVVGIGGAVLAYLAVYAGELVYARRMGYTIRELPREHRARARSRARWIAAGVLATGVWLVIAEAIGADLANGQGLLMSLFGAVLIGLVNYRPWAAMVAARKEAAEAQRQAEIAAERAELERIEAEEEAKQLRAEAAERERIAAEQAALAEANRIVATEDDRIEAGKKFAARWRSIAEQTKNLGGISGPGWDMTRSDVVVAETRKLTTTSGGEEHVVGWEFLIKAAPGVLTPRSGIDSSPFETMRRWFASMLETDVALVDLTYQPTRLSEDAIPGAKPEKLINHGLVTLSEGFPLGQAVRHPLLDGDLAMDKPVYIDEKTGAMYGFAGRDMRGRAVYRLHWAPGQAGGAGRYGVTGTGKSVITQVTTINDLLLGIFPIIHDAGKSAMDFADFFGIIPVGFTNEHRDVIRETMWHVMKARQKRVTGRLITGLNGMRVTADPTWDPKIDGAPMRCTWEEFHMHMGDPKFVRMLTSAVRLIRSVAAMMELATQGTGLADTGDNVLREQVGEICIQLLRMTDHTANLTGYRGTPRPSELPAAPGWLVMKEGGAEPVAYRSAFFNRKANDEEALIYQLRQPSPDNPLGVPILQAPWMHEEDLALFEKHGLQDLWDLGKTESGRDRLMSEADSVESTVMPSDAVASVQGTLEALNAARAAGAAPRVVSKPKLAADDVILAMLKHRLDTGLPGMTSLEMNTSPWWQVIEGPWSKSEDGVPSHTTINRACAKLASVTTQRANDGTGALIQGDGSGSSTRWSLLAGGVERSEQMLTLVRTTGVLGATAQATAQATPDIVAMEQEAMLRLEQQLIVDRYLQDAMMAQQEGAL